MVDERDFSPRTEKVHHFQRVSDVALHAQGERFQPLQKEKSVKGTERRARIPQKRRPHFYDIREIARGVCKYRPVIGGIGEGKRGEIAVVPIELAAVHHDAAERRAVTADEFGRGMHHDIRAVL